MLLFNSSSCFSTRAFFVLPLNGLVKTFYLVGRRVDFGCCVGDCISIASFWRDWADFVVLWIIIFLFVQWRLTYFGGDDTMAKNSGGHYG